MAIKVSIIITAYNAESELDRSINSVLEQTYSDFQLIIVDNASTDGTGDLIKKYSEKDSRIIGLKNEVNVGVGDGRNTGVKFALESSGSEFLFFLDADDWIHPQCLELYVKQQVADSSDIIFSKHKMVSEQEQFKNITEYTSKQFSDMEYFWWDEMGSLAFVTGRLIRKSLFSDVLFPPKGLDDERTTYKLVYKCSKVSYIYEDLYFWYQNPNSYMHNNWTVEKLADQINSVYEPLDYYYNQKLKKSFDNCRHRYLQYVANRYLDYTLIFKKEFLKEITNHFSLISILDEKYSDFGINDSVQLFCTKLNEILTEKLFRMYNKDNIRYGKKKKLYSSVLFYVKSIAYIKLWRKAHRFFAKVGLYPEFCVNSKMQ